MERVEWLSFVGAEKAAEIWQWHNRGRKGPNPLAALPIPYTGGEDLEPGDRLYVCYVNFPGTRFELLGRLDVRSLSPIARDGRETAVAIAKRGTATRADPVGLPQSVVDALRFLHRDGSEHHVKRAGTGDIRSGQFGGRSNLRELVAGAELLDAALVHAGGKPSPE